MSRKPLIAGNWKMNLNHHEAARLVEQLGSLLPRTNDHDVDVVVIPPFTDLVTVDNLITSNHFMFRLGAQDISSHDMGAYTGEISGDFLRQSGCSYTIVGHSERRTYHHETNQLVAEKALASLRYGMTPIICVGEHLEIRQAGQHLTYCLDQLTGSVCGLTSDDIAHSVIAYEPVWAIGTGQVASPDDAQEVCQALRTHISSLSSPDIAATIRILYGGSVTSSNSADLLTQSDIDGALVGGASLNAEQFSHIVSCAAETAV